MILRAVAVALMAANLAICAITPAAAFQPMVPSLYMKTIATSCIETKSYQGAYGRRNCIILFPAFPEANGLWIRNTSCHFDLNKYGGDLAELYLSSVPAAALSVDTAPLFPDVSATRFHLVENPRRLSATDPANNKFVTFSATQSGGFIPSSQRPVVVASFSGSHNWKQIDIVCTLVGEKVLDETRRVY